MNPAVSIIVPYYNTPKEYLFQCLQSLINQSYRDIEVLIVNDGSKTDCKIALEEASRLDTRIRVFHKKNGGVSSARNLALGKAQGDYVCFVDSDDWVELDFVEVLINAIQDSKAQMAVCNWVAETQRVTRVTVKRRTTVRTFSKADTYHSILHSKEIQGFLWNKIFRKDFITKKLNEAYHYCEDLVFVAHYVGGIDIMAYCNKPLYHYRQTGGNATSDFSYNPKILTLLSAYKEVERIYKEKGHEDVAYVENNLLKIALNIRARYLLNRINNEEEISACKLVIKDKLKKTVLSSKLPFGERINIILTWLMPVPMFRIKCLLLNRTIQ